MMEMIKTRVTKSTKCQFCGKVLEQRQIVFKVGENEVSEEKDHSPNTCCLVTTSGKVVINLMFKVIALL